MDDFSEDETRPGVPFTSGAKVGSYLVEEVIAAGGYGTVYRARHAVLDRSAALKILHPQLARSPTDVARFIQEAQAVNQIRHANIIDIFEIGTLDDGRPYFLMEWLDGRTLKEELDDRGPLAPALALASMEQLCAALGAAHAAGVVHRDFKDSNVIALPDGEWFRFKLVDFGLAKLVDVPEGERQKLTATGVRMGTPLFMSPEQFRGEPVDARTDIYAAGILLYRMLTGQLPYLAETFLELQLQHLSAPIPRASDFVPVPEGVDGIIRRCMAKGRDERYGSVEALLADLRAALGGAARQPRRNRGVGIGMYIEVRLDPDIADDPSDAALDDLERVIAMARERCVTTDLTIAQELGNALLAIGALPAAAEPALAERERVLSAARALLDDLRARAGAVPGVCVAIRLHVAPVIYRDRAPETSPQPQRRFTDSPLQVIGGELLTTSAWTADPVPDTITLTVEASNGLPAELDLIRDGLFALC